MNSGVSQVNAAGKWRKGEGKEGKEEEEGVAFPHFIFTI